MSEMVERVARAVVSAYAAHAVKWQPGDYDVNPVDREVAIAAIEAMREPTIPMIDACGEVKLPARSPWDATALTWWRTMINEALK